MAWQIFIWWLVIQALGLAALPLASFFFHALPDRGYAFSKPLGLLLTGYLAWLLAMLGLAPFGAPLLIVCALAVGVVGLLATREPAAGDGLQATRIAAGGIAGLLSGDWRAALGAWLRARWLTIAGYEALFLAALLFLALLRGHEYPGPHPWGTERPMDFALFNAIQRSTLFPPHDPWLAGYSINYYYFGYLLMAVMGLLSGLEPAVAYNLSLALIFALTALGSAGIAGNLIALTNAKRRTANDERAPAADDERPSASLAPLARQFVAVLTAVMVLVAGNQAGALQVIVGDPRVVALDGRQLIAAVAQALRGASRIELPYPVYTGEGDFNVFTALERADRVADFNWWWPSRVVWDDFTARGEPVSHYTITEFPFFSFWLGDMHPHVMALPFGLLALALALQTLARQEPPVFGQGRHGWLELALTGVVLGSLYVINSWDFPTYMLLFFGALLLLYARRGSEASEERAPGAEDPPDPRPLLPSLDWRRYLGQAALAGIASMVLFGPFYLTFRSLVGGKEPLVQLPVLGTITRTIGIVAWSKTGLHSFLIIFGLFLLPLLAYVAAQARRRGEPGEEARLDWRLPALRYLPWATLVALVLGVLIGFPLLALERAARPAAAFALWTFTLVCLILLGTEIVYIRDVFESRMNTIFKFYYQAWLIWGVLAGYALWWLYARFFPARLVRGLLFGALFALLLAGALVYPWLTAGAAFRDSRLIGLEGKTPRQNSTAGAAAIDWLRRNAPGDAVVLEAVGPSYDTGGMGFGGVSASTGLATVLGWAGHEYQWRGGDPRALAQIAPRETDVKTIYSTTDVAQARSLLHQYGVDYIYVGAAERAVYPLEGLAKLDRLGTPVFQQDEVTIYRVDG